MEESKPAPQHIVYSTVTGYFMEDDATTDNANFAFDYAATNFGLIERPYDADAEFDPEHKKSQWQRFGHEVFRLNRAAEPKTQYKVLFMGRHGQGYHNVAESFYGTEAWDCYWSHLDGSDLDGKTPITWVDSHLTAVGIEQALKAHAVWRNLILTQNIPFPEIYFVSPMTRCLETANLTFSSLQGLQGVPPYVPKVKELLREVNGEHTCDRRSTKTQIKAAFPNIVLEEGFTENDELWVADLRETDAAIDKRTKTVFDDILHGEARDKSWISITSHSGQIASALRVLGHRPFRLGTGQVIPVLVKIKLVKGEAPDVGETPWAPAKKCDVPPPRPSVT